MRTQPSLSCIAARFVLPTALLACGAIAQPTITNESIAVQYVRSGNYFSIASLPSGKTFVFHDSSGPGSVEPTVTKVRHETLGAGEAIILAHADGNKEVVLVFPKLPFALFRNSLHNGFEDTVGLQRVKLKPAAVDLGKSASELITLGTGGLLAADSNPGSYAWLAVAEPQSRHGVVFGWLTHDRGSGVLFTGEKNLTRHTPDGSVTTNRYVTVQGQIDYGSLSIAPGKTEALETLAIGYFDDARLGLEQWADALAKVHKVRLKPQPTGYCTWYSQPHGGAADAEHLAELAEFSAKHLKPFGFSVVQIDDKWQAGWKRSDPSSPKKDFRTHDPKGPYPKGMKAAAAQIKSLGLVPGIWFMPFAGTVGDPFFDQHLDWFAKTPDGKPYDTPWGGTCLDLTNPDARAHVRDITRRICREWGFDYIKIDGLWTGTATKQLYVNSGYKEDDLGQAVFKDPDQTNIEVYRSGLKLVREAAGENVFILGCNAPQNMRTYGGSFGLVDAMRIGPDNKADWKSLLRGPTFGTRHYFLHGRLWWNDPDPVYVRESIPLKHAQLICTWVALSGQLNLSSEWIPGLSAERLDILKRTMPPHHAAARPVDLFEHDLPRIWVVSDAERGVHAASMSNATAASGQSERPGTREMKRPEGRTPARNVIGLYNWESSEQKFDVPLERFGLDAEAEYVAFDYWENKFISAVKGRLQLALPAESCVALAIRPRVNHPQLISTSRHVTQGIVDVVEEKWDAASRTLSGRSKLVGGDPYELRIVRNGYTVEKVTVPAADVGTSHSSNESLARVKLTSPSSREVSWSIQFK